MELHCIPVFLIRRILLCMQTFIDLHMPQDEISSSEVRAIGIMLNGDRSYGWRENLSVLTGASTHTIRSWCDDEAAATHRTCSGPAARLLRILSDLNAKNIDVGSYMESILSKK